MTIYKINKQTGDWRRTWESLAPLTGEGEPPQPLLLTGS